MVPMVFLVKKDGVLKVKILFFFFGFSFKRTILGRDGEKMGLKRNLEKMGEVGNFWDFSSRIFKRRGGVGWGGGGIYTKKLVRKENLRGLPPGLILIHSFSCFLIFKLLFGGI